MNATATKGFDATHHAGRLRSLCETFWQMEADIVSRYLQDGRSNQADIAWLRLAAYKETRLYRELDKTQRMRYDNGDATGEPFRVLDEEMRHYRMICGLITELAGVAPAADEVLEFPADRMLQDARATLRASHDPLDRHLSTIVEGGGGAMYRILGSLDATPFDRRLAAVFKEILADEIEHGPGQWPDLIPLLLNPDQVAHASTQLRNLGQLRVAMRKQMFFPHAP